MKHIFLIYLFNPNNKVNKISEKIEKICKKENIDYKIETFNNNKTIKEILKKYQKSENIIISVGNDTPLHIIINYIVGTKNILGFIPTREKFDFYKDNKQQLKAGTNEIDIIKINDYYCLNKIYINIDKNNWFTKLKAYSKGKEIEKNITKVIIHNGHYQNQEYKNKLLNSLKDELMYIYIEKNNLINMLPLLVGLKYAFYKEAKPAKIVKFKEIVITSNQEIEANLDGETIKSNKYIIKVIPKGIKIYYNKKLIEKIKNEIEKL